MTFDSITLQNFGVYGGRQTIDLTPSSDRRPVILFGGLNGGGKTTLLDAVQLVLYGAKARCTGRGRRGYRDYLKAMTHRGVASSEGGAIELAFRRHHEGKPRSYHLCRRWSETSRGIEESLCVSQDGREDTYLSENWDEFIEGYIPSGIAHLFFFDAEQITDLADGENSAEILGTAIHTLLGLDLVDRLETDLIVLERRKRSESRSNEDAARIERARQEWERMQQLLDEATSERGALGTIVGRLVRDLECAEARFRKAGGELFQNRGALEAKRERIRAELDGEQAALRELAAGPAPLLFVPHLLEQAEVQARAETEARQSLLVANVLNQRDEKFIKRLKKQKLPAKHLQTIESLLLKDRKRRLETAGAEIRLDADEHLVAELRHLRTSVLPEIRAHILDRLESVASLQERLTRLDLELARVPAEESIADLQRELERLRARYRQKQADEAALADKVQSISRQCEDAEDAYKRELGTEVDFQIAGEHLDRVLRHSSRVRDTLGRFRVAVIRNHAERLERLVLDSFTQLLRKTNLVSALRIDPSTFRLELTGGDGKPLSFDRLSAGERQLLATSLLWGLAKASGRPLPTIIDTPLGRLDSSHRRHLLERYFPVASHQVILLSTDEEIDEASAKRLKPVTGRSYSLQFEEATRTTKVTEGYFW